MLLASYSPFPLTLLLQEKFDAFFDRIHSTRVTFFFRVIIVPLLMAAVIGVVALLCTLWIPVLVCGLVLGFLYAASVGSSLQMTSAWEPLLVVWAQIGNTIGAATSVVAFFIFSFTASTASKAEFQVILLVPIAVCIITSSTLMYWHFKYDLFEHVYRRLAYDLEVEEEQDGFPPPLLPLTRGTSADAPVYPKGDVDTLGVPLWVPWYSLGSGTNTFMTFLVLPFATYFGDADLAQTLVLSKWGVDLLGRCVALLWGYWYEDSVEPIHFELASYLLCRMVVAIVLALRLLHVVSLHRAVFLTTWCFFFFSGTFLGSLIDVVCTRCTVIGQRKAIARRNALVTYAGLLTGLCCSVALMYFTGVVDPL